MCSDRYGFRVCDFLTGGVKFRAVIRNYSAGMVSEYCHRVAQFIKDLIMTRDYYGRYEGCIMMREEVCHIIEFLAVE